AVYVGRTRANSTRSTPTHSALVRRIDGRGPTVLSYAIVADYFPVEIAARANGALNLLHFGWAFAVQYGIGLIVSQWATQDGRYPLAAYQAAFGLSLALQVLALLWFAVPWFRSFISGLRLSFPSL